jgi:Domain of unknown function (DUF1918)
MKAQPGDWLVVKGQLDSASARRAMVLEARGRDGSAPFLVRWIDSGHEAIVFPGPDAVVVTAAEQPQRDGVTNRRIDSIQSALEAGDGDSTGR